VRDLPRVLDLIKELADYEHGLSHVTNTVESMTLDGFGPHPIYGLFVAEDPTGVLVGISVYYYRYSTWKGKRLFLEDIVVTQSQRGQGVGAQLFERTLMKALEERCTGVMWQVLGWNEPAIRFYKKYGARLDPEWINCSLESAEIVDILRKGRRA
jgi:GNAT superfamily N-acetyltransferase